MTIIRLIIYGNIRAELEKKGKIIDINDYLEKIKKLKKNDIIKLAKQLFVPENTSLLIVTNKIPFS